MTNFKSLCGGFFSGIKGGLFDFVLFTGIHTLPFDTASQTFNGFDVSSVFDTTFNQWYGFTQDEMDGLLEETGLKAYREQFRMWYGGYSAKNKMGEPITIYNPFSVIKAIKSLEFGAYWADTTSGIEMIINAFKNVKLKMDFCTKLYALIRYGKVMIPGFSTILPYNEWMFTRIEYGRFSTAQDTSPLKTQAILLQRFRIGRFYYSLVVSSGGCTASVMK